MNLGALPTKVSALDELRWLGHFAQPDGAGRGAACGLREQAAHERRQRMAAKTALIMAGGTGGHIFPGLALARELRARGWRVHWLGTPASMEERLVVPEGCV